MTSAMRTTTPPVEDAALADLEALLVADGVTRLEGANGTQVDLPNGVCSVLVDAVRAMRAGKAVRVVPMDRLLTTQEAANFLGISRPTLIRRLDEREIPYEQPGRHRRIRLEDLLAYQERIREKRRATLAEMVRQAVADGLYDAAEEDYLQILDELRHGASS